MRQAAVWAGISMVAILSGCGTKLLDSPEDRARQKQWQEDNARFSAELKARREAEAKAEQEAKQAEERRKEAAERQAWIRKHQANGGFVINAVGPVCLYRLEFSCADYSPWEHQIDFSYMNDSRSAIKDIQIQCILTAPSGTALGAPKAVTLYDVWAPGEIKAYTLKLPHQDQAKSAICRRIR